MGYHQAKWHSAKTTRCFSNHEYGMESKDFAARGNSKYVRRLPTKSFLITVLTINNMNNPKFSIITVCYNSEKTIAQTIESVLMQSYPNIEYIIIDGSSTDGTVRIAESYKDRFQCHGILYKIVSEPDNGIYDAMNKGIGLASGDIVGTLNSDDFYSDRFVLDEVYNLMSKSSAQSFFADVVYIKDKQDKPVRYYSSKHFNTKRFKFGFMPAHPSFFTYRDNYLSYGCYKTDYRIAADYELLVRFLYTKGISYCYAPRPVVKMRMGGVSTKSIISNYILNKEIIRACAENGIYTNMFLLSLKYFLKIREVM